MRKLWQFNGGLHLDTHKKESCDKRVLHAELPDYLILPLSQHLGTPAQPIVKVGDKVLKGQIIAQCCKQSINHITARIHASSSGTVIAIENRPVPHYSGLEALCIIIKTDDEDKWIEHYPVHDYKELNPVTLRQYIANAGIVGLGGAGFPSHLKLQSGSIDTLIINGAECEPYITCDDRVMRERSREVIIGTKILSKALGGIKQCIIAVEDNKPEAYEILKKNIEKLKDDDDNFKIVKVPSIYPMGGEKQLIYTLLGKEVPKRGIPALVGVIAHNVATAAAIYRAIILGRPLISRIVTITGNAVEYPQNLDVLLGTPIESLLKQSNLSKPIKKLIAGGPMMGVVIPNYSLPVIKTTSCLIAMATIEDEKPSMPCIRCGSCADACPMNLLPMQLYWYGRAKNFDNIENYNLFDCIECGACSYVCPSEIKLVKYFRFAKSEIKALKQEKQKSDTAKKRSEFKIFYKERAIVERKALHAKKKAALKNKTTNKASINKQDAIKAAMERIKK
jgi:electron transport complex protein RnfC